MSFRTKRTRPLVCDIDKKISKPWSDITSTFADIHFMISKHDHMIAPNKHFTESSSSLLYPTPCSLVEKLTAIVAIRVNYVGSSDALLSIWVKRRTLLFPSSAENSLPSISFDSLILFVGNNLMRKMQESWKIKCECIFRSRKMITT